MLVHSARYKLSNSSHLALFKEGMNKKAAEMGQIQGTDVCSISRLALSRTLPVCLGTLFACMVPSKLVVSCFQGKVTGAGMAKRVRMRHMASCSGTPPKRKNTVLGMLDLDFGTEITHDKICVIHLGTRVVEVLPWLICSLQARVSSGTT